MVRGQNDSSKSKTSLPSGVGPRVHNILAHENRADEDVLDEVYERFAQSDPFLPITHS